MPIVKYQGSGSIAANQDYVGNVSWYPGQERDVSLNLYKEYAKLSVYNPDWNAPVLVKDADIDQRSVVTSIKSSSGRISLQIESETMPLSSSLHQSGIPVGVAPSGTMAANGVVTFGTALPMTYSGGIYLYFKAGAVYSASPAAFFYVVMTNTTVGTVYNNIYSPGSSTLAIPELPTEIIAAGPGAFIGETGAITAISVTIPGGLMGVNGRVQYQLIGAHTNSAGNKTYSLHFGGQQIHSSNGTTSQTLAIPIFVLANRGREDFQVSSNAATTGTSSAPPAATTVNTLVDVVAEIRIQHSSAATDCVVLECASIAIDPA